MGGGVGVLAVGDQPRETSHKPMFPRRVGVAPESQRIINAERVMARDVQVHRP